MAKIKIYELAKELSIESKEIIRRLNKMGIEVKTHMSSISEKDANAVRNSFAKEGKAKPVADAEGFVPRVKRIPKAVIEKEQIAAKPEEEKPDTDAPANVNTGAQQQSSEQADSSQPLSVETKLNDDVKAEPDLQDQKIAADKDIAKPKETPAAQEKTTKEQDAPSEPVDREENKSEPVVEKQEQKETKHDAKPAPAATEKSQSSSDVTLKTKPVDETDKQTQPSKPKENKHQSNNRAQENSQQGNRQNQSRPHEDKAKPERSQNERSRNNRTQGDKFHGNRPTLDEPYMPENKPNNHKSNRKKVFVKDNAFDRRGDDEFSNGRGYGKGFKGKGRKGGKNNKKETKVVMPPVTPKKITIGETVVLGELAKTMGKTAGEIIKKLFEMGIMATINQELDSETAILVADEFGVTVEVKADRAAEILEDIADDEGEMKERPPVVTIMGHVDHGKTSLLDAIRHTNVVSGEAGGITQHIGAYQVEIKGKKITFLDTPGHEAFTAMRARGANMTDIAIIVVAADDGVMPQTIEAINHSKAAGVPIIIAINKIDKPGADPNRVKQELTEYGLVPEEWGGDTIMVEVSAKAGINLEGLLEMILLVAEVEELKANYDRQARGAVIEAKLDKNRGSVATLLVQKGTLHAGDNILAGAVFGKVRAMHDDKGRKVKSAGPSMPVEVLGFSDVPTAGEIFVVVKDEKDARLVAAKQSAKKREEELHRATKISLDNLFQQIAEGEIKELNLVVKADVQGSVEALIQSLVKLNTDEVKVNVIHSGVGAVSESDVMLASASNAIILGFNIIAPPAARAAAEAADVDIRLYRVIYDALEDIKLAMSGLLAPEYKENIIGHVEIRQVIRVPKVGVVAGSYVTNGKVVRNALVRVIRDNAVIADDKIISLRRFKDDAKEVLEGFECGIGLENFHDIKEGDQLEVYEMEEIARQL